jgi:DNA-binding response OmpR family regulator
MVKIAPEPGRFAAESVPPCAVTIDEHIRCIGEKIEKDPARPKLLHTVPGIGFQLLDR